MVKVLLTAMAMFVLGAAAAELSPSEAEAAFRRWSSGRMRLGNTFSGGVKSISPVRTSDTNLFYVMKLGDGKTVFAAGQTSSRPVIAWTSDPHVSLDKGSPLLALIEKDLASRSRAYLADQEGTDTTIPIDDDAAIEDMRVEPFLKTKWAQDAVQDAFGNELACFDYFTPRGTLVVYDGSTLVSSNENERTVCGCVATAMAQTMRYWCWPQDELPNRKKQPGAMCYVPGPEMSVYYKNARTGVNPVVSNYLYFASKDGVYDWENMAEVPYSKHTPHGSFFTDENRCAIGELTYDCGVSVGMHYNFAEFGGSGISSTEANKITDAFVKCFGYSNAVMSVSDKLSVKGSTALSKTILANLDAKCPVILLIIGGKGGHAVVADGYGFSGDVASPYVHLNMGWNGQNDVWYNLPDINVSDNPEKFDGFDTISGVGYNIFPTQNVEIVSGRVTDPGDAPVGGIEVRAYRGDFEDANIHGDLVASSVTDEHGVWSLFVPAGKSYDIYAVSGDKVADGYTTEKIAQSTYRTIGNSWGNDITLMVPRIRVTDSDGGNEMFFAEFGSAMKEGQRRAIPDASGAVETPVIELLKSIDIPSVGATIGYSCTVTTAPGVDPESAPLVLPKDAKININWTNGTARVVFSNLVFKAGAETGRTVINVEGSSVCALAGRVDVDRIKLATAGASIEILAPVESAITVDDSFSKSGGSEFAKVAAGLSVEDLGDSPALFSNYYDDAFGGVAKENGDGSVSLVWGEPECPALAGVASLAPVSSPGDVKYYRSLKRLFADVEKGDMAEDFEVRILKNVDCTVPVKLNKKHKVSMSSQGGLFSVWFDKTCSFAISDAAGLSVSNVVFTAAPDSTALSRKKNSLFSVAGGSSLILGGDVSIVGHVSTNGTIRVDKSRLTMEYGSSIMSCTNEVKGQKGGLGGAVYLSNSPESIFDFKGGTISSCHAYTRGGAVYAAGSAVVNVSGSAVAQGNTSGNNTKVSDDVYFGSGDKSLLNVKSPLSGCVGISYATPNMAEGEVCARLDGWTGPDERTLAAIVQSQKPLDFEPAVCETNETLLVWKAADKSEKSVPEELADVRMTKAGSESACYQTLVAALSLLKEDESVLIELLHDIDFTNSLSTASAEGRVPVRGSVVLDGRGFTVSRRGSLTLDVAERSSLVLTNIVLSAADGDVAGSGGTNAYLRTVGGSITLAAGAKIRDLAGGGSRAAGAVAVQRGVFTMEPGSEISNCINYYVNASEGTGCGGGVLVDEGTVYLRGGIVTGCAAYRGGGVALANKSVAYVSGSVRIYGNTDLDGNPSNLMASDIKAEEHGCTIILEGELASGAIGYIEGTYADTNIFGKVSAEYLERATTNELLKSAGRFTHDSRDVVGVVVTNSAGALLVWSDAVDPSGRFIAGDGAEYRTLDATADEEGEPETIPCLPFTFTSIVETPDGKWRLTLAPGVGYCTYSLYASDVPLPAASAGTAAAWGAPVAVTNLVSDGEFMFEVESSTAKKFWAVKGEDGVK